MSFEARAAASPSIPSRRDFLSEELASMAAIGRVLDGLDDPAVRQRVLRWANERFLPVESPIAASTPIDIIHADPGLAVDSLDDMFSSERVDRSESHDHLTLVDVNRPAAATLRSFVSDFQRLAKDWQNI